MRAGNGVYFCSGATNRDKKPGPIHRIPHLDISQARDKSVLHCQLAASNRVAACSRFE